MTPEERLEQSTKKVEASRARAAKQELNYSLAKARLKQLQDRNQEKLERLFGSLLVLGAAEDRELGYALTHLVDKVKQGPSALLLTGWKVPQLTYKTTANIAQPELNLLDGQARSEV